MRVILTDTPKASGIGRYVVNLINACKAETKVYSLSYKKSDSTQDFFGEVIRGRFRLPLLANWYFNRHYQSVAFGKLARILSNQFAENTLYHYTDITIRPMTPQEKSVITVHDLFRAKDVYKQRYGYGQLRYIEHNLKMYFKFENLIVDSNSVANEILDLGYEFNPKVVYPPVDPSFIILNEKINLRKKLQLPEDKFLVLSVSTDDPRKNLKVLPETMEKLGPNFRLVRVGPPSEHAFNFSGISNSMLNDIYNACDVLIFPSTDEGFGIPLAEAMTVGLPIVALDIPVVKEVTGNTALLCSYEDMDFHKKILETLERKEEIAREEIKRSSLFTFDVFSKKIGVIYDEILSKSN